MRKLAAVLGVGRQAAAERLVPTPDELRAAEQLLLGEAVYALLWQIRIAPDDRTRRAVASTFDGLGLTDASFRDHRGLESTDGAILAAAGRVAANRKRDFSYREIEKEIRSPSPDTEPDPPIVGSLRTLLETRIAERTRRDANWKDMPVSHDDRLALSLATYERLKVAQDIVGPGGSHAVLDNRAVQQAKATLKTAADYGHSVERLDKALDAVPSDHSMTPRQKGNRLGVGAAIVAGLTNVMSDSAVETGYEMIFALVSTAVLGTAYFKAQAKQARASAVEGKEQVVTNRKQLNRQATAIHLPTPRERRKGPGRH